VWRKPSAGEDSVLGYNGEQNVLGDDRA